MKKILIIAGILFLFTRFGYCETKLEQLSVVSFHFVTDKSNAASFKMVVSHGNEELYLESTPQLTIEDIDSASLESIIWEPEYVKEFKERGLTPPPYKILIKCTESGSKKLGRVTSENLGKRLGIIINGQLLMAPKILEPLTTGEMSVQGQFTGEEAKSLVDSINKAKSL